MVELKKKDAALENCNRILKAAIQEFGKKGYKQGSTNCICETLGVSKGIIFYYFKSKEQLFLEAVTLCMDEFYDYMNENFIKGTTPLEGIKGCCLARKNFFTNRIEYLRLFCEVLYRNSEVGTEIVAHLKKEYEKHTFHIIEKILEGVELNTKINREENIWMAVRLLEIIDLEMVASYEEKKEKIPKSEELLERQMQKYEGYLEILLYGILNTKMEKE